jgi:hypothetical protein
MDVVGAFDVKLEKVAVGEDRDRGFFVDAEFVRGISFVSAPAA